MHYRDAQDNCRLIMGPNGHLAEPQTTEENDEIIKNAKTVLGYRWLNLKRYLQYRPIFMKMNVQNNCCQVLLCKQKCRRILILLIFLKMG